MSHHYWIPDGSEDSETLRVVSYRCKVCDTLWHMFTEMRLGHLYTWSEYYYSNGDYSMRFDFSLKDPCAGEWDLGKWLPGVTEI